MLDASANRLRQKRAFYRIIHAVQTRLSSSFGADNPSSRTWPANNSSHPQRGFGGGGGGGGVRGVVSPHPHTTVCSFLHRGGRASLFVAGSEGGRNTRRHDRGGVAADKRKQQTAGNSEQLRTARSW